MSSASLLLRAAGPLVRFGGRRPALAAMLLGVLGALALPPVHALPLLLISFPGLVWLIDRAPRARGAFAARVVLGFGHFALGHYWIANAMLVDPARFGWMIPFAVFGLAAVLGVFPALAALAARVIAPAGVPRVLMLAAAWAGCEWLRGWVLTGFPWNLIGSVWMPVLPVAQWSAVVGAYGLAVPTVLAAAMPAVLAHPSRRHWAAAAASWAVLVLIGVWGAARIPDGAAPSVEGVRLRLVQGNVAQTTKWQPELRIRHLYDYVALSSKESPEPLSAVIWPETAVAFFLDRDPKVLGTVAAAAPPHGLVITGAPRAAMDGETLVSLWNSVEAVTSSGRIVARFDKVHLVPFGEYVPLRRLLPFAKLVAGAVDFSSGPGLATLDLPGLPPVSPTICYEDIFPGKVALASPRPTWLLNVTNDGWFGNSAGPYQHFAAARLRAIEEGLPMVRAANTGITGIIDPYGRVTERLALGEQGIVDGGLPQALGGMPPFARFGNWMALAESALALLVALLWRRAFAVREQAEISSALR